jgi:hypothetical protein
VPPSSKTRRRVVAIGVLATVLVAGAASGRDGAAKPFGAQSQHATQALNAIQVENANPGTPGWDEFASVGAQDAISGYGSKISLNHGDSIDFYVTTTAASFTIEIFRTGWYGGVGARLMASLGSFPGVHQPIPPPDPVTGMVAATNWTKTTTLNVPASWVTGVYLARLNASNGNKTFILFVVRNDGGTEPVLFQTSVTTYEAYNSWGGTSLYENNTNKSIYKGAYATKVSFDRPFHPYDGNGAGHFFAYEYPLIRWAEAQGRDMTYITDVDTHTNVNPLTNHRVYLSVGHDEYWSKGMRDNVSGAIAQGVNAAFFSANSAFWQIRFEPNSLGAPNRVEVGYKDFATESTPPGPDPQYGVNNAIVTTHWRDPPVNNPENALLGVMYQDQVNSSYAYVVQNASNWIYAGTGFVDGSRVPGIVGYEYDKVWNNGFSPPGLTILSNSPVVGCCEGSGNSFSNSTIYTAPSGARVFASGTIQWSWGLDNYSANYANAGIQKTTANILDAFSAPTGGPAPTASLVPSSLGFGSQRVGTTTAAQTTTLTNSGTAALTIGSIAVTGANAGDFAQTNTCPATLAAGASCTITVRFTPGATGSRAANVTVTDNAAGSPHIVALSGTGTAPAVSLTPGSLAFGSRPTGTTSAAQSSTVKNTGTAPLAVSSISLTGANAADFAQTNTCPATLAANATCTISVTFTPSALGDRAASVTVGDDAADSPQGLALSGTGTPAAPAVSLAPASIAFVPQRVGTTSGAQTSTLTNSGSAPLAITSVGLAGANPGDFAQTNDCPGTLAIGASCTISATFGPTVAGTRNANVSIGDDAAGSPHLLPLSGAGTAPAVSLTPSALAFAAQMIGTTSAGQATTLKNAGSASLAVTNIAIGGADAGDYAQTNTCPATLAPNASCTISVTFSPSAAGNRSASVTITDDAADNPQSVPLNGMGTAPAPAVSLAPGSLSFGSQRVGTTGAVQATTLQNSGLAPLTITSIALAGANPGDFSESDTCPVSPATLAAGATCTISVTFTPLATGSRSAAVSVTDDAAGSPHAVALGGTGTAPAVSLTPGALTFGSQLVGTTSPAQTTTLKNTGTAPLAIAGIALGGANPGDYAQTNACPATLAPNASCTVSLTFTPTALGSRTATVAVTDDAAGSPHSVTLSGTATDSSIAFDKNLGKKTDNVSRKTITLTTSAAAASRSRAFVFVNWNNGTRTLASVTGGGLSWTIDRQAKDTSNYRGAIASADAPAGLPSGTVITATFSAAVTHGLIAAASFTGIASTSPLDAANNCAQGGVAAWTCSVTTTNASDLVLGWSGIDANTTSTAAAPNTEIHDFGDVNYHGWATSAYRIESSSGSKTVNGSWLGATGATANVTVVAAYKAG